MSRAEGDITIGAVFGHSVPCGCVACDGRRAAAEAKRARKNAKRLEDFTKQKNGKLLEDFTRKRRQASGARFGFARMSRGAP